MKKAENSKISISKIDKFIKENCSPQCRKLSFDLEGDTFEISVKQFLTPEEELACSYQISSQVFIDGNYTPEVFYSSTLMNFILFYTNIKVEIGLNRAYQLAYGSDIIDKLISLINQKQWANILDAARERIEYRNKNDASVQEKKILDLVQRMDDATSAIGAMTDTMKHIDPNTIQNAVSNIANMSEEKIIHSVASSMK